MPRFCNEMEADSFAEDRGHGLIYGSVRDVDTGRVYDWDEASDVLDFCAYCGTDVDLDEDEGVRA